MSGSYRTYRDHLVSALLAALATTALMATADVLLAASRGADQWLELGVTAGALYLGPALAIALLGGLVLGAGRATFGERLGRRLLARLRTDRSFDNAVAAGLLAALVGAAIFAALVWMGALLLVAGVQRQTTGAVLLAVALVGALPVVGALTLPVYRLALSAVARLPRSARIPLTLLLLAATVVVGAVAVLWFARTRLEWQALDLGPFLMAGLFALSLFTAHALVVPRVSSLLARVPLAGVLLAQMLALAILCATIALQRAPTPDTLVSLSERTTGARVLLTGARALSDDDGDGFSDLLGGPDCDDSDPAVHPAALEVPGNGIDDNCLGGDRPAITEPKVTPVPAPAPAPLAPERATSRNALIIMVDTLRANRLGVTGYRRQDQSLTPNMDRLARSGTHFVRTYAQGPNTARSFPAFATSRYSSQVVVDRHFKNFSSVLPANQTVFEVLQDAGIRTVGYSSHYYFAAKRGVRQGFDEYDNAGAASMERSGADTGAPRIVPKVLSHLDQLAQSGERFAVFVHLFAPHSSYLEHPEFPIQASGGRARKVEAYDYEVAYADGFIGQLLDRLDERGLAESTAVLLFSDHGEAFGEHRIAGRRSYYHGKSMYEETLRVPFILRAPGVAPRSVETPAMLIDAAPTLLEVMGIPVPEVFVGTSLVGLMHGDRSLERPVFAELLPAPYLDRAAKMMVTGDGRYKLIYLLSERRFELYDLREDPGEQRDLYRSRPELARRLRTRLIDWIEVELP